MDYASEPKKECIMITASYSTFFKELAENNHKEWFHTNKKRYEKDIKQPFLALAQDIITVLKGWDATLLEDPKKALFRINRDVRFSKDKSPYNLMMKASFAPGGRKSELPGYYLGIDAEHIHVGGGLFMVQPSALKRIRELIAKNPDILLKLMEEEHFKSSFGRLKGEKAKRLDKAFLPIAERTPYIYYKQFYAFAEFPLSNFYDSDRLFHEIMEHYKAIKPLNNYLSKAFQ